MEKKTVIFTVISATVLLLCLFLPAPINHSPTATIPLNQHIQVEPGLLYRKDNLMSAVVIGDLRLDIDVSNLPDGWHRHSAFSIQNLSFKPTTRISLNWLLDGLPKSQALTLSNPSQTPLNFNAESAEQITELHVLIHQNANLGDQIGFQDEIQFSNMALGPAPHSGFWPNHFKLWLAFNPMGFESINTYSADNITHHPSLLIRLSIWLIFSAILQWLMQVKKELILGHIILAWSVMAVLHFSNRVAQKQQISAVYSSHDAPLNGRDKEAKALAEQIEQNLMSINRPPGLTGKVVIIGGASFTHQRLLHHLSHYNIARSTKFLEALSKPQLKQAAFVLSGPQLTYCENMAELPAGLPDLNVLWRNPEYCLVVPQ